MPSVAKALVSEIFRGHNPYADFRKEVAAKDLQGWGSEHPFLTDSIDKVRPRVIVEVGVWKGGSCVTMARRLKEAGMDAAVIAVDTWLGSWEHWIHPPFFPELSLEFGCPTLYRKFLNNVLVEGLEDYIVPLPLDSANAAQFLKLLNVRPQMIHIDGGHDYDAASSDLRRWWPFLSTGGILLVDDYDEDRKVWPEVGRAVDDFVATLGPHGFEATPCKCRITKLG